LLPRPQWHAFVTDSGQWLFDKKKKKKKVKAKGRMLRSAGVSLAIGPAEDY
jgi:hypothetical protein